MNRLLDFLKGLLIALLIVGTVLLASGKLRADEHRLLASLYTTHYGEVLSQFKDYNNKNYLLGYEYKLDSDYFVSLVTFKNSYENRSFGVFYGYEFDSGWYGSRLAVGLATGYYDGYEYEKVVSHQTYKTRYQDYWLGEMIYNGDGNWTIKDTVEGGNNIFGQIGYLVNASLFVDIQRVRFEGVLMAHKAFSLICSYKF